MGNHDENFVVFVSKSTNPEVNKIFNSLREQHRLSETVVKLAYSGLQELIDEEIGKLNTKRKNYLDLSDDLEKSKKKREKALAEFLNEYTDWRKKLEKYSWGLGLNFVTSRAQRIGMSKKELLDELEERYDAQSKNKEGRRCAQK